MGTDALVVKCHITSITPEQTFKETEWLGQDGRLGDEVAKRMFGDLRTGGRLADGKYLLTWHDNRDRGGRYIATWEKGKLDVVDEG